MSDTRNCGCCNKPKHIEPTIEDYECCKRIHNIDASNYKKFKSFDFSEIFCNLDARFNFTDKIDDEIFQYMIERSVNIEKIVRGNKAIHSISRFGTPNMIKMIIDKNVDLSMNSSFDGGNTQNGWQPIFYICMNYRTTSELIKYLVDKNVNFELEDKYKRRPIQFLCENKNFTVECLEYMISKGTIYNYKDTLEETPLLNAFTSINLDIANFLIVHGCAIPSYKQIELYWHNRCSIVSPENKKKVEDFILSKQLTIES